VIRNNIVADQGKTHMNILVTGGEGFIGRNLRAWLSRIAGHRVWSCDVDSPAGYFDEATAGADVVFHLAGINRPQNDREFQEGNVDVTARLCERLLARPKKPLLVLSSSTQALLDNPYGISKRRAEALVASYSRDAGGGGVIYRLPNVFGKWCRPNYNSAVATFCHNISRDLPISVSDPNRELELVYVDDVVRCWLEHLDATGSKSDLYRSIEPTYRITLGELVEKIRSFRAVRQTLSLPDFDEFNRKLYATYLSYLEPDDFAYGLERREDPRGALAEFIKSNTAGQLFVSRTRPGVTRGNHYHHTKTEKFLVVEGKAVVRFRHLMEDKVIEYPVCGKELRVVDIPPGYTHSIENVGSTDLVTLFWASEIFDQDRPDTCGLDVRPQQPEQPAVSR
jgi:UDP-2-acetamido-2,6-beta-L-arabino-hexul-4-ose reductase